MNKKDMTVVWFDLETTGLELSVDKIIEVSMIKTHIDGTHIDSLYYLLNPNGVPIKEDARKKHNISDAMLLDKPVFSDVVNDIYQFIENADYLGGYNVSRFDIPMLAFHFMECDVNWDYKKYSVIDPYDIWIKEEPRNLSTLYKKLTGKTLENSHSAKYDIEATIEVFSKQCELYDIEIQSDGIHSDYLNLNLSLRSRLDISGMILIEERDGIKHPILSFGKYRGVSIYEVFKKDLGYLKWVVGNKNFPKDSRVVVRKIIDKLSKR